MTIPDIAEEILMIFYIAEGDMKKCESMKVLYDIHFGEIVLIIHNFAGCYIIISYITKSYIISSGIVKIYMIILILQEFYDDISEIIVYYLILQKS